MTNVIDNEETLVFSVFNMGTASITIPEVSTNLEHEGYFLS